MAVVDFLDKHGSAKRLPGFASLRDVLLDSRVTFNDWIVDDNRREYLAAAGEGHNYSRLVAVIGTEARRRGGDVITMHTHVCPCTPYSHCAHRGVLV
jgi:hypothetical protein